MSEERTFNPPFDYQQIDEWQNIISPAGVHCMNTVLTAFFRRYLEARAFSVFDFGVPETWNAGKDFLRYVLYRQGFFTITRLGAFGVTGINCTLNGVGLWYQPTDVLIANPALEDTIKRHLGTEAVLIKMKPDYTGIWDLILYYADQLALIVESVGVNLLNTRLAYVFGFRNENEKVSFERMFDRIISANPAVFVDKKLFNEDGTPNWLQFEQNVGQNYISDRLMIDYRKTMNDFDTLVGIPNSNLEKKERMNVEEINANNVETYALADTIYKCVNQGIEEARKMFGAEVDGLSFEYSHPEPETLELETGVDENAGTEI